MIQISLTRKTNYFGFYIKPNRVSTLNLFQNMSYKPTATVGPTVTGSALTVDKNAIDYQLMNVMEKTIALQQFADKLRNEKFLAKKRMQMNYAASEFSSATSSTPPIRCNFVKASKALTADYPSPSSAHGLNVDAPSFTPSMYSSPYGYVTPPPTPTNSLITEKFSSPTVVGRPYLTGIDLLAQKQQRAAKIGNTNRSLSTSDVDEYQIYTTKDLDTSNGNWSKRFFYSSNGSAITTPESLRSDLSSNDDRRDDFREVSYGQRTSGPNHVRLKQPQFNDTAEYRYDRVRIFVSNSFSLSISSLFIC